MRGPQRYAEWAACPSTKVPRRRVTVKLHPHRPREVGGVFAGLIRMASVGRYGCAAGSPDAPAVGSLLVVAVETGLTALLTRASLVCSGSRGYCPVRAVCQNLPEAKLGFPVMASRWYELAKPDATMPPQSTTSVAAHLIIHGRDLNTHGTPAARIAVATATKGGTLPS